METWCSTLARSQSATLHALYRVHHVVQNNKPLSALFDSTLDEDNLSDDESTFLRENELSRYFTIDIASSTSSKTDMFPVVALTHPPL